MKVNGKPHIKVKYGGGRATGKTEVLLAKVKQVPGAFIQDPPGEHWGSREDLLLAHLIYHHVKRVAPRLNPPDWAAWADALRLMREDGMGDVAHLTRIFELACAHPVWGRKILSPAALRRHWVALVQLDTKIGHNG